MIWLVVTTPVPPIPGIRITNPSAVLGGSGSGIGCDRTAETALAAAEAARQDGYSVGVLDLRSISPLDVDSLKAVARRTGRLVVVHEASTIGGIGSEIAAAVTETCFYDL